MNTAGQDWSQNSQHGEAVFKKCTHTETYTNVILHVYVCHILTSIKEPTGGALNGQI